MGEEKLDNTVYTIRGLRDLADMAASKGDTSTATWASERAAAMEADFEQAWWYGGDARQYADSLANPDNSRVFQRHWIGVTPMDAMLVRPGKATRPLADDDHGVTALEQRERPCFTGEFGLYHTGTGPTSAPAGNPGPSCDSVGLDGPERAQRLLAEHRHHGRRRRQLRPDGHRAAAALHHRQREDPARPDGVGDAGRDAGDRARG